MAPMRSLETTSSAGSDTLWSSRSFSTLRSLGSSPPRTPEIDTYWLRGWCFWRVAVLMAVVVLRGVHHSAETPDEALGASRKAPPALYKPAIPPPPVAAESGTPQEKTPALG